MASTYSTDLKIELMVTGENAGTWGDKTNTNWNVVQQAIAGYEAISIAGGAQTTTLVMTNATLSSARNAVVKLTGTITGNQIVTIPDGIEKTYIIENGTTGAFTVQFKTVSGTGPTFSTTDKGIKIVYSDGTNVVDVNANLSGPTLASDLNVNGKSIISTSNGDIVLAPNGSGDVQLDADTVRIGDSNANATLTTNGTGDLILNTNSGSNSGSITIKDGVNGDIEITPNGTGVVKLDGLSYPTADGTADQVLKTNGSGVISFGTISSSPTQLVQSIPLQTGNSVTAGKLLSIGSSGEIVPLPTLNTFGTTRTNAIATGYNAISTTGDTAIRYSQTFSGGYQVVTFVGIAMSNSANPTTGGTTVTYLNGFGSGVGVSVYPITSSKFLINTSYTYSIECYGSGGNSTLFIINVDPTTGNCTKGNELSLGGAVSMSISTGTITKDLFVSRMNSTYQIIRNTTGNTIAGTSDADALDWVTADLKNSIRTTNNILGIGIGATWRVATYTPGTPAIGTKTDTAQIADYQSDGQWAKMGLASTDDAEYMIVTYTNTSSVGRYITYSVNQTTGALTQIETGLQSLLNSTGASSFRFKDKDSFIGTNASFAFINGARNTSGFINTPYTLGTMRYNSSNLFYSFDTSFGGYPTNTGYTVNAYGTNSFNYIGVAKTTDSTSPVDVVTDGVAAGFTSLTPGTLYYSSNPADGNVTTSSSSGILVGKAISSTEILLQRSNSQ
jgi:hypothetical protein